MLFWTRYIVLKKKYTAVLHRLWIILYGLDVLIIKLITIAYYFKRDCFTSCSLRPLPCTLPVVCPPLGHLPTKKLLVAPPLTHLQHQASYPRDSEKQSVAVVAYFLVTTIPMSVTLSHASVMLQPCNMHRNAPKRDHTVSSRQIFPNAYQYNGTNFGFAPHSLL